MKRFSFALLVICLAVFQAEGSERMRVGVLKFQNSAGVEPSYATTISTIFTQMLGTSEKLAVMAPEQLSAIATQSEIPMPGYFSRETAIEIGKLADCRYVIVGTVTSFRRKSSSTGIIITGSHKEETTAEASISVYDTSTGATVFEESASGRAAQGGSYISIYGVSTGTSNISGTDAGAIAELSERLSLSVRDKLAGDKPKVTAVNEKEVTLNIGSVGGAVKGKLYRIYTGSIDDGNIFAVVKVDEARPDSSRAVIAGKNAGSLELVHEGDNVYPVTASELKALQKKKAFLKSRPKKLSNIDDILALEDSDPHPATGYENVSTDPKKVIPTYGLTSVEATTRITAHVNAAKFGSSSMIAYDRYTELAQSYENDYLAAYKAGVIAANMKRNDEAEKWFHKALDVNPNYIPAREALADLQG